jgi:MFS family permease
MFMQLAGARGGGRRAGHVDAPCWDADLARQQTGWLVALTVSFVPLGLVDSTLLLGILLLIVGFAVGPAIAVQFNLASRFAPAGTETEALTWVGSMIYVGGGVGAAVAESVAPSIGVRGAFLASVVFAGTATLLSMCGRGRLREIFAPAAVRDATTAGGLDAEATGKAVEPVNAEKPSFTQERMWFPAAESPV